jgi:phosphatidate cytidylyltransferase
MSARRHQARPRRRSELAARTVVAIPAVLVAVLLIGAGGLPFCIGLLVVGWLGLHELYGMYPRSNPPRLAGFLGLAAVLFAAYYGGPVATLGALITFLPVLFLLAIAQPHPRAGGVGLTVLALYWIGLPLAHGVMLRSLPHGGGVVFDVVLGTLLCDTAAYIGGHLFGRHKLAPRLSPGKTVEGLLIGVITAVGGVWLASRFQEWLTTSHALLLGLGVGAAGPLGDLFESFIKRDAGVKDSGKVFGPHGGVLDRLDAMLFTAVVGYYIWKAYG